MPSNVRGGAGRDAGIDRTLLMKVDSLAGGRTSTVGGGAFSMSLPFWDTAAFGAVKCLIFTSFCWSIRESSFAMRECFRLGRFQPNLALVPLMSNSFLSSRVSAVVSSGRYNDCFSAVCTSACCGEGGWLTFERCSQFKMASESRIMAATPVPITQYSDVPKFRAGWVSVLGYASFRRDSSLSPSPGAMLGTAPAVSGQGTGAGSAIELSTEHCIAAVAKHANFFNCSISESLNDRGEFENTSRMPLTPFWTHNGTATIDRTRKARHAWKSTRGSNSVSSQNSNFPVRMHSPDIPDSVLKQEPRVGAVSPIRARQITAPSLSLRSATAAPVAPVDLHASSVNRTMKSFTPNSFDQTLSSNASNDGDAAAFRGSL